MFTFTEHFTFKWPVKVIQPVDGEDATFEFTGLFKLPQDELEIFKRADGNTIAEQIEASRARLAQYWIGWEGIGVEGGGDLPYSEETRARLLRQRPIRLAVDAALADAVMGIREKN